MNSDLKKEEIVQYAKTLVSKGKENLEEDGELDPIGVVIYGRETKILRLDFSSAESKIDSCNELCRMAKKLNAMAAGVMFTAAASSEESSVPTYYRVLLAVFKGPRIDPFMFEVPFQKIDDKTIFLDFIETYDGVRTDLLLDWY